jgi:diacylglycerol kinase (ATP)
VSTVAVIVNPRGGTSRRRLAPERVAALLRERGLDPEILSTERSGHATELAAAAAQHHPVVVAVGGDGTVHEVARGLVGSGAALAVFPSGSGNDFAAGIGVARRSDALAALASGSRRPIDVGYLGDRPFFNSVGLFLSGRVSLLAARLWRPLGALRYVVASLKELVSYRPEEAVWELDGERRAGSFLMAEICNGPRTGGGFYMVPEADPGDGRLDVCLVRPVGLLAALRLLPAVMKGASVEHPAVERLGLTEGSLELPAAVTVHLDGEPGPLPAGCYRLSLQAGGLDVLVPGP